MQGTVLSTMGNIKMYKNNPGPQENLKSGSFFLMDTYNDDGNMQSLTILVAHSRQQTRLAEDSFFSVVDGGCVSMPVFPSFIPSPQGVSHKSLSMSISFQISSVCFGLH